MMRYARGFKLIFVEMRQPPNVKLYLNMVEAQRDALKARREIVKRDSQFRQGGFGDLEEVRRKIEIIDMKQARARYREEIDLDGMPMITSEERRTLQTKTGSTFD